MQTRIIEGKSVFAATIKWFNPAADVSAEGGHLGLFSYCGLCRSPRIALRAVDTACCRNDLAAWTTLVFIANVPVQAGGEATIKIISKIRGPCLRR